MCVNYSMCVGVSLVEFISGNMSFWLRQTKQSSGELIHTYMYKRLPFIMFKCYVRITETTNNKIQ